ncbi:MULTISPECIES: hypothetical protein [Streptomyces]|uniref:SMI1/KNR4 family protein n=1 Tax=Streptomyces griseiscabiei TaxID=2993540 RepID=A0ABU4L6A5_9ACTN|nr:MULTISPECIES: hypothetical protein [Streptomyces]MBZ3906242.1 hypothetical protein [Streptomyces griseiscabiei]MDX2911237.1 hypothetical protein [Streptomyces griseiscabiei]
MDAIFELPPQFPLASTASQEWSLLPLRVPMGWNIVYNTLLARRLPDGRVEINDSEDLYWARTARPPWLTAQEAERRGGLQAREISIDAGWYHGHGFRIVVLDPDWHHEGASFSTSDLGEFIATLEGWMRMITERGELPKP